MRAQRFPLELPIRYRRVGDLEWLDGITEDISHSGVLFRVEQTFDVDTAIDVRIVLPAAMPAGTASEVVCQARIVRAEMSRAERAALAAAFSQQRLIPLPNLP